MAMAMLVIGGGAFHHRPCVPVAAAVALSIMPGGAAVMPSMAMRCGMKQFVDESSQHNLKPTFLI